jgi:hypothetical protein
MENPYLELHREFRNAGAEVLISSGQACVLYGIAAFSKDGDWIIRENRRSCDAVLAVLEKKNARYRLGVPLDPRWLKTGWTSHFEYRLANGFRMRADFCSRPPRVTDIETMWKNATQRHDAELVDVESLILLKQTRRERDFSVIGALAQAAGLKQGDPAIALGYLQDYRLLQEAVHRWSEQARSCGREAVKLCLQSAPRAVIVAAIALEKDEKIQADEERIMRYKSEFAQLADAFMHLKSTWEAGVVPLSAQHRQFLEVANTMGKHL